jgi:hypothetical protein
MLSVERAYPPLGSSSERSHSVAREIAHPKYSEQSRAQVYENTNKQRNVPVSMKPEEKIILFRYCSQDVFLLEKKAILQHMR